MNMENGTTITVEATINAPIEKVWEYWTKPGHITKWNNASDEWHSPSAVNDLRQGGNFSFRMEAKDGSIGFDFEGVYNTVKHCEQIKYVLGGNRKVTINFIATGSQTKVTETFEAESVHPVELQQAGWQAILDNFKKYTEANI
jgi:uncharacterized protein YndB with AHSA1/START domain